MVNMCDIRAYNPSLFWRRCIRADELSKWYLRELSASSIVIDILQSISVIVVLDALRTLVVREIGRRLVNHGVSRAVRSSHANMSEVHVNCMCLLLYLVLIISHKVLDMTFSME